MDDRGALKGATDLWREAYGHQMEGELEQAVELYRRSIATCPTPEAHTFLAWTMGLQGRFEEAIGECLLAIEIDPDFGNPYNDIGVYLMERNRLAEAVPWLNRAKRAKRYEPRQFPYMNLGRLYVQQGRWWQALRELEAAVRLAPRDARASEMLHHLRGRLN